MYKHILIPVANDNEHDSAASFEAAKALADADTTFTVLHVIEAIPTFVAAELPSDVLMRSRDEAEAELKAAAAGLPGAKTVLASGHAGSYIVQYAQKENVDCIVIASHKPGIEDFFLGSTAARVVRHSQCSVHVIR